MTGTLRFSIDGRPSQELFFTAGRRVIRVGMDGEVEEVGDDDLAYLRNHPLSDLMNNADVQQAFALASAHARRQGLTVEDDTVYFD